MLTISSLYLFLAIKIKNNTSKLLCEQIWKIYYYKKLVMILDAL